MTIKVYGSKISTATLRVLVCLAEKELDYELIYIDLASGQHKTPHMISLNPFGQIPAFEDGDIKLIESRAIMKYISRTYPNKGTNLISQDPKKKAEQSMWMEVESQKFEPATKTLVWELCMKKFFNMPKDNEATVNEHEKVLENLLDVYETRLMESKYLAGDSFSMADLQHVPVIKFLMETQTKQLFDARPHVSMWVADILSRPATLKVFKSRAIMKYISRTYPNKGTNLISQDPKKKAEQSMWMEVESQKFEPATKTLVWELCMKKFFNMPKDNEATVNEHEKVLENLLDVYETRLMESKYLAGDSFSMADLQHVPVIKFLMETQTKQLFDARPHVSMWVADILSRPATLKVFST